MKRDASANVNGNALVARHMTPSYELAEATFDCDK